MFGETPCIYSYIVVVSAGKPLIDGIYYNVDIILCQMIEIEICSIIMYMNWIQHFVIKRCEMTGIIIIIINTIIGTRTRDAFFL